MTESGPESTRLRTAKTYLSAFATLSTTTMSTVLAQNYTHTFAPSTLSTTLPTGFATPTAFLTHLTSLSKLMTGFPVTPLAFVEDAAQNAVWCHARSRAEWREEVVRGDEEGEWAFAGEYVFMFWMEGKGERVVRTVEMLDSLATVGVVGLMERARGKVGG